ncbi:hypothetical protein FD02_GL001276 [Lacticaseibacillus nasuensis JCM 17158]|uniref:Uncharacterized protein n=1 Tax=Lacticaseibacillus nasuensis JCM 17158 TaxID=1291734 RepID=A0A0R1JXH3_9LACO|nr:hypothetical protein FD02_GL001276 [Lacticaseibacillus nasuensis JCM 17158]
MHLNTVVTAITGTGIVGAIVWGAKTIKRRIELDRGAHERKLAMLEDNDRLQHAGMVALLHHEIYELCNGHIERGSISTGDLDDLGYLFTSYKALGGNGTGEALYKKVLALPIKNQEESA